MRSGFGQNEHGTDGAYLTHASMGDGGRSITFWLLIVLGLCVLTPCVLLPAWREHQTADVRHRMLAQRVELAEQRVAKQRKMLEALHSDPAAITRAAMRELDYTLPGQDFVIVETAPPAQLDAQLAPIEPKPLPVSLRRLADLLPDLDYDAVFCRRPIRSIMMTMSAGLIAAAFAIFWPRRRMASPTPTTATA